jgi:hypothetical protein
MASPGRLLALLAGILVLAAIVIAFRMRPAKQSPLAAAVAVLPAFLMLLLFYSLAGHMRQTLGAWPSSIGERGFPALLLAHSRAAEDWFIVLVWISMFAWPAAFLVCVLVRRWRTCVYYLGLYALACLVAFGAMLLAPAPFLEWWMD